mmetsp:Transcript_14144/g.32741  ORF Transcript_14144/g.32741 Transcript_14144/m.32741 type:complete len:200 (+) Transcript_14144:405-1004(+)
MMRSSCTWATVATPTPAGATRACRPWPGPTGAAEARTGSAAVAAVPRTSLPSSTITKWLPALVVAAAAPPTGRGLRAVAVVAAPGMASLARAVMEATSLGTNQPRENTVGVMVDQVTLVGLQPRETPPTVGVVAPAAPLEPMVGTVARLLASGQRKWRGFAPRTTTPSRVRSWVFPAELVASPMHLVRAESKASASSKL